MGMNGSGYFMSAKFLVQPGIQGWRAAEPVDKMIGTK